MKRLIIDGPIGKWLPIGMWLPYRVDIALKTFLFYGKSGAFFDRWFFREWLGPFFFDCPAYFHHKYKSKRKK